MISDTDDRKRAKGKPGTTFPYYDLEQAADLARTVHDKLGGSGTADQVAAHAGQTPTSGAFRLRLSSAIQFGLMERDRDRYRLAALGMRFVEPGRNAQAKVAAFLNVPLYKRIFNEYRGRLLPPPQGIESYLANAGVVGGQVDRARQAFQRSAEQAGLFQFGKDRLVLPPGIEEEAAVEMPPQPGAAESKLIEEHGERGMNKSRLHLHTALEGMLQELPQDGESWTEADMKAWADAFLGVLRVVHKPVSGPNTLGSETEKR